MSSMPKHIKVAFTSGFAVAVIFAVIALVRSAVYGVVNYEAGFVFCIIGFCLGLMAAPEFEPKSFKRAWVLQIGSGVIGGAALAILLSAAPEIVFASAFIGGFLGFFAPAWLKHV